MLENRKFKLIIDSTCDLPLEIIKTLDVKVLKFPYIIEGQEYEDDLWESTKPEEFYARMLKGSFPSTTAYPIAKFLEHFTEAAQEGKPTVYLSFPAALSGSYNMALMAQEQVKEQYPDFELHIVDSCLPSITNGQLVLQAARMRDQGMSAQELVAWADESKNFIHGYFTLDNMDALAVGGRIPSTAAQLGSKLDIKPLLSFDLSGALNLSGMTRGRKRALKNLADKFKEHYNGDMSIPVFIGSAFADKDVAQLIDMIKKDKKYENLPIVHCSVGPVIGSHVGPGMIAISFWGTDRRESSSVVDRIAERVRKHS